MIFNPGKSVLKVWQIDARDEIFKPKSVRVEAWETDSSVHKVLAGQVQE